MVEAEMAPRMKKEDIWAAGEIIGSDIIKNKIGGLVREISCCYSYTRCVEILAKASVLLEAGSYEEEFAAVVAAGRDKEEGRMSEILHRESHDNHIQS